MSVIVTFLSFRVGVLDLKRVNIKKVLFVLIIT